MDHEERSRHLRADTELGARLHAAGTVVRGKSVDLSRGGVRIRRLDDDVPCPAVGTAALIELELGPSGWIAQDGRVVRCDFSELAIAFDPVADAVARLIDEEIRAVLASVSRPRLLVVDPSAARRHHIAEKLRAAGCDPYEAATPLEAIDLIERPSSHIAGVAVAEHLTQTDGQELCEFVAETNPGIKLALLGDLAPQDDELLDRSLAGIVDPVGTSDPTMRRL